MLTAKIIMKKKQRAAGCNSQLEKESLASSTANIELKDIEIEIDNKFFINELLPTIHKTFMSNVKV